MRGQFIVLEGPDGAGTTKHSVLLEQRLKNEGRLVLGTFEPTDGPLGSTIRLDLLNHLSLSPVELQKRFCSDRAWHLAHVIEPALKRGATVICDRYLHSTLAYGLALGVPRSELDEMNKKFIRPDVTLFLLPPLAVLLERMGRRGTHDALEKSDLQQKVYAAYQKLAQEDPSIIVIDTSGPLEGVAESVRAAVAGGKP
jgi:dTMP kinase